MATVIQPPSGSAQKNIAKPLIFGKLIKALRKGKQAYDNTMAKAGL